MSEALHVYSKLLQQSALYFSQAKLYAAVMELLSYRKS